MIPQDLQSALFQSGGIEPEDWEQRIGIGGGDTCTAFRVPSSQGDWFVKWTHDPAAALALPAEVDSLTVLQRLQMDVPRDFQAVCSSGSGALIMRFEEVVPWSKGHASRFSEQLSQLYTSQIHADWLPKDATIGRVPVEHGPGKILHQELWDFRFEPLLKRAAPTLGEALSSQVRTFVRERLVDFPTEMTWVHGDLWSGNVLPLTDGRVLMIDPVVHISHPELDLAMMNLFGGFPDQVAEDLVSNQIISGDWRKRMAIWQLIPALVHVIMFGAGYLQMVRTRVHS